MSPLPQTIHQLSCKRIAVAMGIFDGVHLGHQKIIRQLVALAQETKATSVALFFAPHPKEVLFGTPPLFLTSTLQKAELLRQYGAEQVICMPFTKELAAKQPDEFLSLFLPAPPVVTGFCVGKNWRFGCKNAGDATTLADWAHQFGLQSRLVEQVCHNGEPISSTRIRAEITDGNLKEAAAMLGHPISISGTVRHGNGIAKSELDCPTANICEPGQLLPPYGVYAATAQWEGKQACGIVYVGEAPTIRTQGAPVVVTELHLFDVEEDLYGKQMTVAFHEFIRPSIRFPSATALQQQIAKDIETARNLLDSSLPCAGPGVREARP